MSRRGYMSPGSLFPLPASLFLFAVRSSELLACCPRRSSFV